MDKNKIMVVVAVVVIGFLAWWMTRPGPCDLEMDACKANNACAWTEAVGEVDTDGYVAGSCAEAVVEDTDSDDDDTNAPE